MSPREAIALQQELRHRVRIEKLDRPVALVGGVDVSYNRFSDRIFAAVVLLDPDTLTLLGYSGVEGRMTFPYIPGLLSFRELPALLQAWQQLQRQPDLVLVDGQGIAHPRRLGLASHLGVETGCATIGCAKNRLTGDYDLPGEERGQAGELRDQEELLGYVLRTKRRVKPMYISPGHRINAAEARDWALRLTGKYRLPEPTRQAHLLVNALRRGERPLGWHWLASEH